MSDLVLDAAECVFCGQPIKGYIVDNSGGDEGAFAHLTNAGDDHTAWPDPTSFQIVPSEVWHAIAVADG